MVDIRLLFQKNWKRYLKRNQVPNLLHKGSSLLHEVVLQTEYHLEAKPVAFLFSYAMLFLL